MIFENLMRSQRDDRHRLLHVQSQTADVQDDGDVYEWIHFSDLVPHSAVSFYRISREGKRVEPSGTIGD